MEIKNKNIENKNKENKKSKNNNNVEDIFNAGTGSKISENKMETKNSNKKSVKELFNFEENDDIFNKEEGVESIFDVDNNKNKENDEAGSIFD